MAIPTRLTTVVDASPFAIAPAAMPSSAARSNAARAKRRPSRVSATLAMPDPAENMVRWRAAPA